MPTTKPDVLTALFPDEPDLKGAAEQLGPGAIPYLVELVNGPDLHLASRAALLAGWLDSSGSVEVLERASTRSEPAVRVAAAVGAGKLRRPPTHLVVSLLEDPDPGVRKWAIKSAAHVRGAEVNERIRQIADSDPESWIRSLAASHKHGADSGFS